MRNGVAGPGYRCQRPQRGTALSRWDCSPQTPGSIGPQSGRGVCLLPGQPMGRLLRTAKERDAVARRRERLPPARARRWRSRASRAQGVRSPADWTAGQRPPQSALPCTLPAATPSSAGRQVPHRLRRPTSRTRAGREHTPRGRRGAAPGKLAARGSGPSPGRGDPSPARAPRPARPYAPPGGVHARRRAGRTSSPRRGGQRPRGRPAPDPQDPRTRHEPEASRRLGSGARAEPRERGKREGDGAAPLPCPALRAPVPAPAGWEAEASPEFACARGPAGPHAAPGRVCGRRAAA